MYLLADITLGPTTIPSLMAFLTWNPMRPPVSMTDVKPASNSWRVCCNAALISRISKRSRKFPRMPAEPEKWTWQSTIPGIRTSPEASMTSTPSGVDVSPEFTLTILSSSIRTKGSSMTPLASTRVPPLIAFIIINSISPSKIDFSIMMRYSEPQLAARAVLLRAINGYNSGSD
ncbi:hypothetical protein ES707_12066 [subsurface metagenome]